MNLTMDGNKAVTANFGPWTPPLGTPAPEFGIFETHRMYEGRTYDFGSGSEPYKDAGNGPYTHYIDNTDPNATDTSNPFGTASKPRRTFPAASSLGPGAVLEVHGGPYTTIYSLTASGTQAQPIFVRGPSSGQKPIVQRTLMVRGHYIIIENLDLDKNQLAEAGITVRPVLATDEVHHVSVRNCEVRNGPGSGLLAVSYLDGVYAEDVVFYANHVHPGNMVKPGSTSEPDNVGIGTLQRSRRVWIVDNHIHHLAGDCVGSGHAAKYTTANYYVGRNVLHDTSENAVDLKEVDTVIVSENTMYGYSGGSSGQKNGVAVVIHYGPTYSAKNVWLINNEIYDSNDTGIQVGGSQLYTVWVVGNVLHDISSKFIRPYMFESYGQGHPGIDAEFIISKLLAKGYIDAHGVVNPSFTGVDAEFKSWFPADYDDEYAYMDRVLNAALRSSGTAKAFRTWSSAAVYWVGNTIYNADSGMVGDGTRAEAGLYFYNNIIMNTAPAGYHLKLNGVSYLSNSQVSHSIFYQTGGSARIAWGTPVYNVTGFQAAIGKGEGCLDADPLFVGPSQDNFLLQKDSPSIDVGKTDSVYQLFRDTYARDIRVDRKGWSRPQGLAWDIGAYEYALGAITTLAASGTSQNSVSLTWTVPGEQGVTGTPARYDIRYAGSTVTEANWDTATQVQGELVPGDFGDSQSFTITGLNPGATYYVAIKVLDEVGHASALSNVVSRTTATSGNHAPVLTPVGDRSVVETATLTFSISATDADGDTLVYSATNLPTGASFTAATRTFTWTPASGKMGTHHATLQVSDGHVTVSETITITVRDTVNHAPVLGPIGDKSVNENALLSFSVSATDPDGDSLTFSVIGLPTGASLASGVFSWTPNYNQAGSYEFTLTVSDGELTDSQQVTITVVSVLDRTAPAAHDFYPVPDAIQAPLNPLIALTISDDGSGVDAGTVAISVNNQLVYSGDSSLYESAYGVCRRTGTRASYRYYYRPAEAFDFSQQVSVYASASDAAHNAMTPVFYRFVTEMRSFGRNQSVSSSGDSSGHPAIATDSQGNLWAAWHAGQANARDIYVAKHSSQGQQWDAPLRLTNLGSDQCHPAIAIGSDDTLHVVWQDNRRGNWDIYGCSSADGSTWQDAVRITDSNDNQTNPVIATDHAAPSHVYVAWEDDGAGNQDIYLASASASFAGKTITRITSNVASQTEPALAVGSDNTVYLVWTDQRNGSADIYGSSSSASSWANVPIVTGPGNQSNPVIAVEPGTSTLQVLWVDDAAGNLDVVHGLSTGLPGSPISGTSIVDDATGADQSAPTIVAARDHRNNAHVYACWQDNRSVGSARDSDLYFVEIRSGTGGTNILVGDDGVNSNQSDPALGVDEYGQPAVLWVDSRDNPPRIYSACSTYFKPVVLASALVARLAGGRVGTDPALIDGIEDVSIQIPANACDCDVVVSISEIQNPPKFTASCITGHEIGPTGVQFSFPATVTIPYTGSSSGRATPYWYDAQTGTLSQQGMTEITNRTLANGIPVVSFKTTHLTAFYVLESPVSNGVGGGGGGCALSNSQEGSIVEFLLPYGALVLLMLILKWRDRRYKGT